MLSVVCLATPFVLWYGSGASISVRRQWPQCGLVWPGASVTRPPNQESSPDQPVLSPDPRSPGTFPSGRRAMIVFQRCWYLEQPRLARFVQIQHNNCAICRVPKAYIKNSRSHCWLLREVSPSPIPTFRVLLL